MWRDTNVCKSGLIYRSEDAFFRFPASVELDLRVAGLRTVEVVLRDAVMGRFLLPP